MTRPASSALALRGAAQGARQEPSEKNFPSAQPGEETHDAEFEIILEDGSAESEERRLTKEILVIIPRGVRYRVDVDSVPGATCLRIPVEVTR